MRTCTAIIFCRGLGDRCIWQAILCVRSDGIFWKAYWQGFRKVGII